MQNNYILTQITCDSVEENGRYNLASGDRLTVCGEFEKAFAVYMLSAREGYAPCQNSIGCSYDFGEGVTQDLAEAARWYKMAADQNNRDGQYNLSQIYMHETGVENKYDEGMEYLIKAANNNHPLALHNLGCIYDREGKHQQAFECYIKSADSGYQNAQHNLALCYANGEGTQCNYEKAIHWFKVAAKNGCQESIKYLRIHDLL